MKKRQLSVIPWKAPKVVPPQPVEFLYTYVHGGSRDVTVTIAARSPPNAPVVEDRNLIKLINHLQYEGWTPIVGSKHG